MPVKMILSFDVEPDRYLNPYTSLECLERIANFLSEKGIPSTFFILGEFLERHGESISGMLSRSIFEIASHSYFHREEDWLSDQDRNIAKSIRVIEKYFDIKPYGFRAPRFVEDHHTKAKLSKNSILYDTIFFPFRPKPLYPVMVENEKMRMILFAVNCETYNIYDSSGNRERRLENFLKNELNFGKLDEGYFSILMHPHIDGKKGNFGMFKRIIEHLNASGVEFTTYLSAYEKLIEKTKKTGTVWPEKRLIDFNRKYMLRKNSNIANPIHQFLFMMADKDSVPVYRYSESSHDSPMFNLSIAKLILYVYVQQFAKILGKLWYV